MVLYKVFVLGVTEDPINTTSSDPDISVRRKTVFLLNSLILPANTSSVTAQQSSSNSITHQSNATANSLSGVVTGSAPSIIDPTTSVPTTAAESDSTNDAQNNPIHPNSHEANLRDPSRTDTSTTSLGAFERHDIIGRVISSVTNPVPFGQDGENDEPDADFEEKAMQWVFNFMLIQLESR